MTVQLYSGCFGVTRGGRGVPQGVVGPATRNSNGMYVGTHPWRLDGLTYRDDGSYEAIEGAPCSDDIIAVFPDRARSEAYLRGEAEWGPWRSDISEWNVTTHDVRFECVGGIHKISTRPRVDLIPRPVEPAQAAQVDFCGITIKAAPYVPPGHMMLYTEAQVAVAYPDGRIVVVDRAALIAAAKGGDQ